MGEIVLGESCAGRTLDDILKDIPDGVQVTMVRKGDQNFVPDAADRSRWPGDALLVVADRRRRSMPRQRSLDASSPGASSRIARPWTTSAFLSARPAWSGIPLAQLPMPAGFPSHLLHVRRYDMDLVPAPDLMLEFGDRVGVLMPPERKEEIRKHFGDTVKATAEFSYVSLGLGMVMGVLLGLIPIPIPGVGTVTLGIGGGPLIVALILGKLRRTGPMLWTLPLPANIVLRNFGLAIFLAAVGINAGQPFVKTVSEIRVDDAVHRRRSAADNRADRAAGRLLPDEDPVRRPGRRSLRRNRESRHLVYSTRMAPTERPDIGYAMIFPSMTIVKVIAVQIVGLLFLAAG